MMRRFLWKQWTDNIRIYALIYLVSLLTVCYVIGSELKLLQTEALVQHMVKQGINYDAFRELELTQKSLKKADDVIKKVIKQYPNLSCYSYIDSIGYLTFAMMANDFDTDRSFLPDSDTFIRGIGTMAGNQSFQELYQYYDSILRDLKYFPVPTVLGGDAVISYDNSWNDLRQYGGNRRHEGTDLMDSHNQRGYFPILSITDGIVENIGWLEKGGYRIGIRSKSGGYFYYAHLYSYADGLKVGDQVIAGQLLGFMGDSGYGAEGTIGKFDVHLHLGIYVATKTGEMSVNPYWVLKMLENHRTQYSN